LREENLVDDWCFELDLDNEGWIGSGEWGNAYHLSDNKVIKITRDHEEFICSYHLLNKDTKYNAKIHDMRVFPNGDLGILMDHVDTSGVDNIFSEMNGFANDNDIDIFDIDKDDHSGQLSNEAIKMSEDLYLAWKEVASHGYSGSHALDIHDGNIGLNSNGDYSLFDQRDKSNPVFDDFELFNEIKISLRDSYIIDSDCVEARTIPVEKILVSEYGIKNTLVDISFKKYSKTDEPIECMYNSDGNLQVTDGYHRLCEALLMGEETIDVNIYYDERCGYSHQTYASISEDSGLDINTDLLFHGLESIKDEETLQYYYEEYTQHKKNIELENIHSFITSKKEPAEVIEQIEEHVLYTATQKIHRDPSDFAHGDLGERLEEFKYYNLTKGFDLTKLNKDEWSIDEDLVEHYKDLIKEKGISDMPNITIDDNLSIIDGIHRLNALLESGITKADAYVGTNKKLQLKNSQKIKI
jgi:hypothetical protein